MLKKMFIMLLLVTSFTDDPLHSFFFILQRTENEEKTISSKKFFPPQSKEGILSRKTFVLSVTLFGTNVGKSNVYGCLKKQQKSISFSFTLTGPFPAAALRTKE
jgi:preprotein translocase subunit SecG